jgi:hypothetical protein
VAYLFALLCLVLAAPTALAQGKTNSRNTNLREPLTKAELKPAVDAVIECAQRNQDAGCLAARQLADRLLDRPNVTALCKDTAYSITQRAVISNQNSYDRKEQLITKANDLMQLCEGKEISKPQTGISRP